MAKLMNRIRVAVIVLNFNGFPYVFDCLKSLSEVTEIGKIIVVDNNSKDRSVFLIKKNFPQIKIIKNRKNLGFARGNNKAIRIFLRKGYDYIMLLNPDTVVDKKFLKPLVELAKSDKKIGIVGPLLKEKVGDKTIYALGAKFNPILGRTKHIHVKARPLHASKQEMVSGCAMLVKKEVFEKIGLFDEGFFLYFEDSDFCLRAGKAGFEIFIEPKSIVYHKISLSLGGFSLRKIRYNLASNFLFIQKHVKFYFWPFAFIYLIVLGLKMIISFLLNL